MKQISTLKKLSEKLGLSISTVSRALKDHPDISEATRKRVKDLAELTEYEPNTFALNLRTNKSKMIGVIVPFLQNLFYEYFISSLDEEVKKVGYSLLILQSGENVDAEIKNLGIMKKNRVDLLFVSVTENTENVSPFLKFPEIGIPVIFFDRVPPIENFDKIRFADDRAGEIAARRLVKSKKKKILCLFTDNLHLSIIHKRIESFKNAFEKLSPNATLEFHFHRNIKEGEKIISKVFNNRTRPDAIFCIGDNALIWTMKTLRKKGLQIPGDIGIISISNGFIPTLYNPSITHVETSGYKLGKLAFTRLKEILEGNTQTKELVMDAKMVEGGSL